MNKPKTISNWDWRHMTTELLVYFVLCVVAMSLIFETHWLVSVILAPALMMMGLLAVVVFVEVLWMLVTGLEKACVCLGMRKTPLS
jgi:vacuolar-type H+-ATPase subunit I/STV1